MSRLRYRFVLLTASGLLAVQLPGCAGAPGTISQQNGAAGPSPRGLSDPAGMSVDIVLKPERDAAGNVVNLAVSMTYLDTVDSRAMTFQAPLVVYSHAGIADRMRDFRIVDRGGEVRVDQTDTGGNRVWRPARPLVFPATVRYNAAVPPARTVPGPPIDLRTFAGGVSGGGSGFLALPSAARGGGGGRGGGRGGAGGGAAQYRIRMHWDLSGLSPGSIGVSSLGEGDVEIVAPLSSLTRPFYMAGPLGKHPGTSFIAYWLGAKDSVDMAGEMRWAANTYQALRTFFGDTSARTYRLFARVLPEAATSGGTASINSFMIQIPKPLRQRQGAREPATIPRGVVAHEMIHGWVGGITGSGGNTQWFGEGATTYFTARTSLRLGLQSVEDYAAEVSRLSSDYYPNPFRNVSADSAAQAFWLEGNGERLPYARGSLYLFSVNARIQKASNRTKSLDDVLLAMFAARSRGEPFTLQTWKDMLGRELGAAAVAEFDSIVVTGAKTIEFAPDALGPCFQRRTFKSIVPDFAFDRRSPDRQIVTSLVGGSAAARAGLKEGDVITTRVNMQDIRNGAMTPLDLQVIRGDQRLNIRYTPSPISVDNYEWSRVPGVSDAVCRQG